MNRPGTRDEPRQGHPAVLARNDLHGIADAWPALLGRLHAGGTGNSNGIRSKPGSKPPIDVHVSDVIAEITEWAHFLGRVLMDEADWTPPTGDTPALLRGIADRVGHFTEHADELLVESFTADLRRLLHLAKITAWPTNKRWVPLNVPCSEHGVDDLGARVPCPGQYRMQLDPERPGLSDMVCDEDRDHRVSPAQWQQLPAARLAMPEAHAG